MDKKNDHTGGENRSLYSSKRKKTFSEINKSFLKEDEEDENSPLLNWLLILIILVFIAVYLYTEYTDNDIPLLFKAAFLVIFLFTLLLIVVEEAKKGYVSSPYRPYRYGRYKRLGRIEKKKNPRLFFFCVISYCAILLTGFIFAINYFLAHLF